MLKEIYEQPDVVRRCLATYFGEDFVRDRFLESSIYPLKQWMAPYRTQEHIQILACGTSYHAGRVGQYLFEQIVGIPTRIHSSSEFSEAPPPLTPQTLTLGLTQSGETADTLAALALERSRRQSQSAPWQAHVLGITNRPDSSLERQADQTIVTPAGKEIAIAATKTFVAQLLTVYSLAFTFADQRQRLTQAQRQPWLQALVDLPQQIEHLLHHQADAIADLAQKFGETQNLIFLGRGLHFPIALEGALKVKETSYVHAEAYAAGEFLHGPIALLDATIPVIAIAPPGAGQTQLLANLQKVKERQAPLIGITGRPTPDLDALFDHQIEIPAVDELFSPILTTVVLQLFAYFLTVHRGLEVDRPRSLQKALTDAAQSPSA